MKANVRHAGPAPDTDLPAVETPSQAIVNKANEIIRCTDARGRVIGIKKLGVLERARFFSMIGGEDANNPAFLSLAVPAQMTVEIDGNMIGRPTSRATLEGRMGLLDEDGIDAVNKAILEHFGESEEAGGADLKNELRTQA